jgi:hypothetical protein
MAADQLPRRLVHQLGGLTCDHEVRRPAMPHCQTRHVPSYAWLLTFLAWSPPFAEASNVFISETHRSARPQLLACPLAQGYRKRGHGHGQGNGCQFFSSIAITGGCFCCACSWNAGDQHVQ